MSISSAEVQTILARAKTAVRAMKWSPKLSNVEPEWLQFESGVRFDDDETAQEDMRIIFAYKPAKNGKAAVSRFTLLYKDNRIYAVDCGPDDQHVNKDYGKGRPFHKKSVGGIHEHLWAEAEKDRYAEPLADDYQSDVQKPWRHFAKSANLTIPNGFKYPPAQNLWKQTSIDMGT